MKLSYFFISYFPANQKFRCPCSITDRAEPVLFGCIIERQSKASLNLGSPTPSSCSGLHLWFPLLIFNDFPSFFAFFRKHKCFSLRSRIFLRFASKSIVFVEKFDRFLQDGLRDPTGRAFASFSHAERHSVVELVIFEGLQ